jgi:hypothetical protein
MCSTLGRSLIPSFSLMINAPNAIRKDLTVSSKPYVKAAFVADYVNLHNKDCLTNDKLQTLTHEAQAVFGQERSPGVTIDRS